MWVEPIATSNALGYPLPHIKGNFVLKADMPRVLRRNLHKYTSTHKHIHTCIHRHTHTVGPIKSHLGDNYLLLAALQIVLAS